MTPVNNPARDAMERYFNEISRTEPLSRQEEVQLSRKIQEGDPEALERLIHSNLRFVVSVAQRYLGQGLSLEELVSAGNLGLITAAERFDGSKGFKFISYAVWWIRREIQGALIEQKHLVRLPLNRISLMRLILNYVRSRQESFSSWPGVQEIAEALDTSPEIIRETLQLFRKIPSLNASPSRKEDDDTQLFDLVPDESAPSPHELAMKELLRQDVVDALEVLDEREQEIIRLYFGLNREDNLTLKEIGQQFGLSRERVRQIKATSLAKLRRFF